MYLAEIPYASCEFGQIFKNLTNSEEYFAESGFVDSGRKYFPFIQI